MNSWLAWTGYGAIIACLMAAWGQLRAVWQQLASRVVVSLDLTDLAATACLYTCQHKFKLSRYGIRTYQGWYSYVRPIRAFQVVAAETLGDGMRLVWIGWRPLLLRRTTSTGVPHDGVTFTNKPVRVSFIRGLFDPDQLVLLFLKHYNARNDATIMKTRYRVNYVSGTAGKSLVQVGSGSQDARLRPVSDQGFQQTRPLWWTHEELGAELAAGESGLGQLSLCPELERLAATIKQWMHDRDWFFDRGLPWKYGCTFGGPPGSGKTCFIRALAQDLGIPIYVFDLATLHNDELRREWKDMCGELPAIALFEDIDSVFIGREPAEGVKLTFDCLLNCMDGIEQAAGLLICVTTNRPETLDAALSGRSEGGMTTRPGRIDAVVELGALDVEGRFKLARRILSDWPEDIAMIVANGEGDYAAQFSRRCIDHAQYCYVNRGRQTEVA